MTAASLRGVWGASACVAGGWCSADAVPCGSVRVVQAIKDQVEKGIHLQQNLVQSPVMAELMLRLRDIVPAGLSRFFFNSA
jgi:hypothetical protein